MNPEDRAAFADARIAAVKAGLKLNADQEKLWPPVEAAVRDFAKLRIDRANARMNAQRDDSRDAPRPDPVTRLRDRADTMATTAAAMKRIADAADPLYKTLDDGQKRRLAILTRMEGRFGRGGWRHHGTSAAWTATTAAGTAVLSGIATIGTAAGQGSQRPGRPRAALAALPPQSIRNTAKSRRIPAAFSLFRPADMTGEYPAGLLDIGESLC